MEPWLLVCVLVGSCCTLSRAKSSAWLPQRLFKQRHELWRLRADGHSTSSPVLSPGGARLYAVDSLGILYAVDTSTGKKLWSQPVGAVGKSPALSPDGSVVYVGLSNYSLAFINASSGLPMLEPTALHPQDELVGGIRVHPVNGLVYIQSRWFLWAIDGANGHLKWSFGGLDAKQRLRADFQCTPALSLDGTVLYRTSNDPFLAKLNASDGKVIDYWAAMGAMVSPVVSPSGRFVATAYRSKGMTFFVANSTGPLRDLTCPNYTVWQWARAAPAFSPSEDMLYFGSQDTYVRAVRVRDASLAWAFPVDYIVEAQPVLQRDGRVVYIGAAGYVLYALDAATGRELWRFDTADSITSAVVLSEDEKRLYFGCRDGNIYALRLGALPRETDWGAVGLVVLSVALVAATVLYILPQRITAMAASWSPSSRSSSFGTPDALRKGMVIQELLSFGLAGAVFGLGSGALLALTLLPRDHMTWSSDNGNYPSDPLRGAQAPFSVITLAVTVIMLLLWPGLAAAEAARQRSRQAVNEPRQRPVLIWLPEACTLATLLVSLLLSCNLVPGLYLWLIVADRKKSLYIGSVPPVFFSWLLASYLAGLLAMALQLGLLEALLVCLEAAPPRSFTIMASQPPPLPPVAVRQESLWRPPPPSWRGHWSRRWLSIVPAYHWGFCVYWVSTATCMYLFDRHTGYVPPYPPLSILGALVGAVAFVIAILVVSERGLEAAAARSSGPCLTVAQARWARARAEEMAALVSGFPYYYLGHRPGSKPALEDVQISWRQLTQEYHFELKPCYLLHLAANAKLPDVCGLRRRCWRCSGAELSPKPGCQESLRKELDWSYFCFTLHALLAVMPLIAYWLATRFGGRELTLRPPYGIFQSNASTRVQNDTFSPLPLIPDATPSYVPMVYSPSASPWHRCSWRDGRMNLAKDFGDFNMCLSPNHLRCIFEWYSCQPAFPACAGLTTTILGEPSRSVFFNLKLCVYASFLLVCLWLVRVEREEKLRLLVAFKLQGVFRPPKAGWEHYFRARVLPLFLLALGGFYGYCLRHDAVTERFVLYWFSEYLAGVDRKDLLSQLPDPAPTLSWICEALGNTGTYAVDVAYVYSVADNIFAALVQGLYFAYQAYTLVEHQSRLYDFIDSDTFMTYDEPHLCSYWSIYEHRERDKISREDVDLELCHAIYIPFFNEVQEKMPDLILSRFNRYERDMLAVIRSCRRQRQQYVREEKEEVEQGHDHGAA